MYAINMGTIKAAPLILYVAVLLLQPDWLSTCQYEFDLAAEARYRDDTVKASQELYCSCGSNSCSFEIGYEHTASSSHTVEGSVGGSFFVSVSASYSHSWEKSATTSSSITCTANPGFKAWVTVVPKMVRKLGWGRKKCSGVTKEEAWIDVKTPLTFGNGQLDAEVWCKSGQFSTCIENANATCHGINEYADTHDAYCRVNCGLNYCPPTICAC